MAKIRTLKGEFFRNVEVSSCGLIAKTLAAGLVLAVADDEGRFKSAPNYLLGEIFTHDAVTPAEVQASLERLQAVGFVSLYSVHGVQLGAIVTWGDHQRVPPSHFKKSKFNPPPNTKRVRHLPSLLKQMSSPVTQERNGEEGKGEERKNPPKGPPVVDGEVLLELEVPVVKTPIEQVFEAWVTSTGKPRSVLDPKRRRVIVKALESYPLEDLLDAVDGWRFSPHHRGENDSRMVYNRLELILRDAEHIEDFRGYRRNGQLQTRGPEHPADARARELDEMERELRERGQ